MFELPEYTLEPIMWWLDTISGMWKEHAMVSSAMERLSQSVPELADNDDKRFQFMACLMSMDRDFYFLYVRNQDTNEELVKRFVARQWLGLFKL
ncbi:hypothetical protein CDES_13850 [Corynebacterium deserti GIMN1.010]|uniref:Uncharacterized protein n=1 Tax=Corynebacterium deserti GIMN1.010 TaxID=931089 RepID=A0A0M4D0D6_9CORY|nr:hypothetical protein [Corynebacterium deserti]ALC07095.1 hypothetical protein CDES_13850 [Corynebacterium deserti GIMN1.010]